MAVGGGLRSPGDFVGGLTVEGRQFVVGEGEEVHRSFFKGFIVQDRDE